MLSETTIRPAKRYKQLDITQQNLCDSTLASQGASAMICRQLQHIKTLLYAHTGLSTTVR